MTAPQLVATSLSIPKLHRVAPPGRPSAYHDRLAALVPGSDDCLIDADENHKKAASRFSSAISQFREKTKNKNAKFTVRTFQNDEGKTVVGVWRLPDATSDAASPDAGTAGASEGTAADNSTQDAPM